MKSSRAAQSNVRRRRQVRFSYPRSLRTLAVSLSAKHTKRTVADLLDLPITTLYRWSNEDQDSHSVLNERVSDARLPALVADCQAHGFDVQRCIETLMPDSLQPSLPEPIANRRDQDGGGGGSARKAWRGAAAFKNNGIHKADRLALTCTIMESQHDKRWSSGELAQIACLSRDHYIKRFKARFGITPHHYLSTVRIARAKQLLMTTLQPLKTIASTVGFDSCSSMIRSFYSIERIPLSSFCRGMKIQH